MAKKAFVTGSSRGIGRGIALKLAEAGYDVAVHYGKSAEKAEAVAAKIRGMGRESFVVQGDVRDLGQLNRAFDTVFEKFGRLDVFVNNAGIMGGEAYCPFLEVTPQFYDNLMNNDYRSYFFAAQRAAKNMVEHKTEGNIVFISSINAYTCLPEANLYGPLKIAINKLVQHLAMELAPYRIRVNAVAPGTIMVDETGTVTPRLAQFRDRTPIPRFGYPEEIGNVVVFLVSEQAGFIDGVTVPVDGAQQVPCLADNTFVHREPPVFVRNY